MCEFDQRRDVRYLSGSLGRQTPVFRLQPAKRNLGLESRRSRKGVRDRYFQAKSRIFWLPQTAFGYRAVNGTLEVCDRLPESAEPALKHELKKEKQNEENRCDHRH